MMNKLLVMMIAAAAGCGVVTKPGPAAGGSDDQGSAMNPGEDAGTSMDAGSDSGSGPGSGSGSGSGSNSGLIPPSPIRAHIKDERLDTIDFSSNAPVHTHHGADIDFNSGCPAVYKYAYLMDSSVVYGSETTPNPLAFTVQTDRASQIESFSAYRVRDDSGHTLIDWTAMTPDTSGLYTISLRRDQLAALGTQVSTFHVDARLRDVLGMEAIESACWENHPMAAPLNFSAAQPGDLFDMSFATRSRISPLINAGAAGSRYGVGVVTIPFAQVAAEDTRLTIWMPNAPHGTGTKQIVNANVVLSTSPQVNIACIGGVPCPSYANNVQPVTTAPVQWGMWQLRVVDDLDGSVICYSAGGVEALTYCSVPARTGTELPHPYHLILSLAGEPSVAPEMPITATSFTDDLVGSTWFTGALQGTVIGCSSQHLSGATWFCNRQTTYQQVVVVNQARIALQSVEFAIKTDLGTDATAIVPGYVTPAQLTLPARTWDAGLAGF